MEILNFNFIVGRLMKYYRQERNIAQGDICKVMEIKQPSLSKIESGYQPLTIERLNKFCKAVHASQYQFSKALEIILRQAGQRGIKIVYGKFEYTEPLFRSNNIINILIYDSMLTI